MPRRPIIQKDDEKPKRTRRTTTVVTSDSEFDPESNTGLDSNSEVGDGETFFNELFDGGEEGKIRVSLDRVSPQRYQDEDIEGYLEDLPPGIDSYRQYISTKYGGGQYRVTKRMTGRFAGHVLVKISGPPRVIQTAEKSPSNSKVLEPEVHDGINIGGDDKAFMARMERLAMIKKLSDPGSAPPSDINAVLLQHILNGKQNGGVGDIMSNFATMAEVVKSLTPEGPTTGTTLVDVAQEAIKAFGKFVDKSRPANGNGSVKPGQIPGAGRLAAPQLPQNTAENANGSTISEEENMPQKLSQQQIAGIAIQNIVAYFTLEPPKEPKRVVVILDNALGLDKETRAKLNPFRDYLFDAAEGQLADYFQENPEQRSTFEKYFNDIFDEFIRADREIVVLGGPNG